MIYKKSFQEIKKNIVRNNIIQKIKFLNFKKSINIRMLHEKQSLAIL